LPGYKSASFESHAQSLQYAEWASVKDFLIAMGSAVDKLEKASIPVPFDPTQAESGNPEPDSVENSKSEID